MRESSAAASRRPSLGFGDVVQLGPNVRDSSLAYCFMVVAEARPWGVIGYVHSVGEGAEPGLAYQYAARWNEFDLVGRAVWAGVSTKGTPDAVES